MPCKDPEKRKLYNKKWAENNKEKVELSKKKWEENNKDKIKEKNKRYRQTPEGLKNIRINYWKWYGIKLRPDEDWDSVYEYYLICEFCEECDITLTKDKSNTPTTKCLDHCHQTGFIRNILCFSCNIKRG